jgi:ADP-ribose pyrophosphatase YjhB (NUDIX family)
MPERVRAIIKQAGKILLIRREKNEEKYWVFPGGAVELGESHRVALRRECLEELGLVVEVGRLFSISLIEKSEGNEMEYFYECRIIDGKLGSGQGPEYQADPLSVGSYFLEWLDQNDVVHIALKPDDIRLRILDEVA